MDSEPIEKREPTTWLVDLKDVAAAHKAHAGAVDHHATAIDNLAGALGNAGMVATVALVAGVLAGYVVGWRKGVKSE